MNMCSKCDGSCWDISNQQHCHPQSPVASRLQIRDEREIQFSILMTELWHKEQWLMQEPLEAQLCMCGFSFGSIQKHSLHRAEMDAKWTDRDWSGWRQSLTLPVLEQGLSQAEGLDRLIKVWDIADPPRKTIYRSQGWSELRSVGGWAHRLLLSRHTCNTDWSENMCSHYNHILVAVINPYLKYYSQWEAEAEAAEGSYKQI